MESSIFLETIQQLLFKVSNLRADNKLRQSLPAGLYFQITANNGMRHVHNELSDAQCLESLHQPTEQVQGTGSRQPGRSQTDFGRH
jgi:hypothetical protein